MSGFTKLHNSILSSTIWREDPVTVKVWITMLAMADADGVVEASIPGLADFARVSIDETKAALTKFLSPDEYSRSKEYEGRRIEVADGGWLILNYDKYRFKLSPEDRKERERTKKQRYRAGLKVAPNKVHSPMSTAVPSCPSMSDKADADAEADAEVEVEVEVDAYPDAVPMEDIKVGTAESVQDAFGGSTTKEKGSKETSVLIEDSSHPAKLFVKKQITGAGLWQSAMFRLSHKHNPDLTIVQCSELKGVLMSGGEHAVKVIDWTPGNWDVFVKRIVAEKKLQYTDCPDAPTVSFFCCHYAVALQLWSEVQGLATKPVAAALPDKPPPKKPAWPEVLSEQEEALLKAYREKHGDFAPLIEQWTLGKWNAFVNWVAPGEKPPLDPDVSFFCANQLDAFRFWAHISSGWGLDRVTKFIESSGKAEALWALYKVLTEPYLKPLTL
jgi:hypothetical protein